MGWRGTMLRFTGMWQIGGVLLVSRLAFLYAARPSSQQQVTVSTEVSGRVNVAAAAAAEAGEQQLEPEQRQQPAAFQDPHGISSLAVATASDAAAAKAFAEKSSVPARVAELADDETKLPSSEPVVIAAPVPPASLAEDKSELSELKAPTVHELEQASAEKSNVSVRVAEFLDDESKLASSEATTLAAAVGAASLAEDPPEVMVTSTNELEQVLVSADSPEGLVVKLPAHATLQLERRTVHTALSINRSVEIHGDHTTILCRRGLPGGAFKFASNENSKPYHAIVKGVIVKNCETAVWIAHNAPQPNITLEDIELVDNGRWALPTTAAVQINARGTTVSIRNSIIHNNRCKGLRIAETATGVAVTLQDTHIDDNKGDGVKSLAPDAVIRTSRGSFSRNQGNGMKLIGARTSVTSKGDQLAQNRHAGLFVVLGQDVELDFVDTDILHNADHGLGVRAKNASISFVRSRIEGNVMTGISIDGRFSGGKIFMLGSHVNNNHLGGLSTDASNATVVVKESHINKNEGSGLLFWRSPVDVNIKDSILVGNYAVGIEVHGGLTSGYIRIENTSINKNARATQLEVSKAEVVACTVSDNGFGINLVGATSAVVEKSRINGNTAGIEMRAGSALDLKESLVTDNVVGLRAVEGSFEATESFFAENQYAFILRGRVKAKLAVMTIMDNLYGLMSLDGGDELVTFDMRGDAKAGSYFGGAGEVFADKNFVYFNAIADIKCGEGEGNHAGHERSNLLKVLFKTLLFGGGQAPCVAISRRNLILGIHYGKLQDDLVWVCLLFNVFMVLPILLQPEERKWWPTSIRGRCATILSIVLLGLATCYVVLVAIAMTDFYTTSGIAQEYAPSPRSYLLALVATYLFLVVTGFVLRWLLMYIYSRHYTKQDAVEKVRHDAALRLSALADQLSSQRRFATAEGESEGTESSDEHQASDQRS